MEEGMGMGMGMGMEMEVEVFEAREVDPDYEFDASMFFDFTREESLSEARAAEMWFESAPNYPPSPFVAKLVWREESAVGVVDDGGSDDAMASEQCETEVYKNDLGGVYGGVSNYVLYGHLQKDLTQMEFATGMTFQSQAPTNKSTIKVKSSVKSNLPRSSTLMKPTASVLAKQNRTLQVGDSRFPMLLVQKDRSFCNSSVIENQAAKRQKLDWGQLRKVGDVNQQTDFIHKAAKKGAAVEKSSSQAKPRLTIPREPSLRTAYRAQRMRPKNSTEPGHETVIVQRFKARPLNRKILEAPSLALPKKSTPKLPEFQEFHLKTSERAMQHTSSQSSSLLQCCVPNKAFDKHSSLPVAENGVIEARRLNTMSDSKDEVGATHLFRARPLNKKIFSSKGDIGVFRNIKRETTVPMEFNLHTERRIQQNPPIDLFSKLSLTTDVQPSNGSHLHLPRSLKGSKENRLNPFRTEHEMTLLTKERHRVLGEVENQCRSSGHISEVENQLNARSLGVRWSNSGC